MVLTLYDKTHNYVGSIVKKNDLKIESQLDNGDKTLSFVYMDDSLEMTPECYIRDGRDEFVVKEVDRTTTGFPVIYAALNLEELEGKAWKTFQAEDCTISEAAQLAIAGTGWTVAGSDVSKKRNAGIVKKSALGVLQDLCTAFMCEMSFDTINKTITFHEQRGSDRGVYFLAGLNLLQLTKKSDSYDFYTRIVPYGADGLDIKEVNSGREYLDNNQYSGKVRTYIWEDTNYTDAQALKDDAAAKLADMSKPKVSYSAQVIDLAEMSADYSLLDYGLGDTVTLIDKNTGTRDKQRIVRLTEYPEEPDRNTCEMSNTFLTWEEMQAKLQASAAIVDALIGSDGNYNGTIKVSDILHFTDGVVGTSSGSNVTLGNFFQTTTGAIGALNLEVGRISANMLTAETADLKYANITFGNLDTANINTAKIKDLFVQVGLIKDAVISGAKITGYLDAVEVNAANITAGTLIADRIAIRGSNTSLVYALNNYGQITSQQTNTIDGYILTERTINANKIVANSITGGEIAANTITAFNIVGNSLSAIYADLGEITAGVLKSQNYSYSSGNYTTTGMIIDLNNKIYRTPNTAILADGSFYTKSGQIGPWTIGATGIYNGLQGLTDTHNGIYIGTDGIGIYDSSKENRLSIKNDASIVLDGAMSSSGTITPASNLPRIIFKSAGGALGDCALVYRDFNNLSEINGLHLVATIGDATFVSDKIVSNIAYIHHSVQVNGANNVHTVIRPNLIQFKPDADVGIIQVFYNSNGYNIIRNHNNGNISVSASGSGLYLGYENTTRIDFLNGKATISSTGNGVFQGSVSTVGGVFIYAASASSNAHVSCYGAGTNANNEIYMQAETDGQVTLGSRSNDGTWRTILKRANNSANITTWGNWYFSNWIVANTGIVSVLPNYTIDTNPSSEMSSAHWFVDKSTNTSNALAAVFGGVRTNGMQYALLRVYNASTSSHTSAQLALYYPKNGTPYASLGCYLDVSGNIYAIHSGDAQVVAGNSKTGNRAYVFANGNTGEAGIYSFSADGTARPILIRANNSHTITAYGDWTFNGTLKCKNYAGNAGRPVTSGSTDGKQVSAFECYNSTTLRISGQWGTTGTTFAWRTVAVSSSDIRLKENIADCTVVALPLINSIRMRAFDWKEDGKHQNIGFIADELEKLDSKLAIGGGYDDGIMNVKSVDTFYLLGYLVKAVQELSAEVSRLKGAA